MTARKPKSNEAASAAAKEIKLRLAGRWREEYCALLPADAKLLKSGSGWLTLCPFHDDTSPSLGLNFTKGTFSCFSNACGAHGDIFEFYMLRTGASFIEALQHYGEQAGAPVKQRQRQQQQQQQQQQVPVTLLVPMAEVEAAEQRLWAPAGTQPRKKLMDKRGYTETTLRRWRFGWTPRDKRFGLPVLDQQGRCINIRRYNPWATKASSKVLGYKTGYNKAVLLPIRKLLDPAKRDIYLLAGEWDMILGDQLGLDAICNTNGEGTWVDWWTPLFEGKRVWICFDVDKAGRMGAQRVARKLHGTAAEVHVIDLPYSDPPGFDFTDYIVTRGHTLEDFLALAAAAPLFEPAAVVPTAAIAHEYRAVSLADASKAEYDGEYVEFAAFLSGKDTSPYLAPRVVRATCPGRDNDGQPATACSFCPVADAGGSLEYTVEADDPDLLLMFRLSHNQLKGALKRKAGVPPSSQQCPVTVDVLERQNVEDLRLVEDMRIVDPKVKHVTSQAYYAGHGLLTNRGYTFRARVLPEPFQQYATALCMTATPAMDSISSFVLTPELRDRLADAFRPTAWTPQAMQRQFTRIHEDMERASGILGRRDVFTACDLVHFSILQWRFQGRMVARGWTEALIVGDTRTGKSRTAQAYCRMYGAGEVIGGESLSFAGLVGGLEQLRKRWTLNWGRLVMAHQRLAWFEEISGMKLHVISALSGIRSSGLAEITKIHKERTPAMVRIIWLGNAREKGKTLADYAHGVQAIPPLIGQPEDISRFDAAVTCAMGEVDIELINSMDIAADGGEGHYPPELYNRHLMWAWSRTPDQVQFAAGTEERICELALTQGRRYDCSIPLIQPAEHRITLARLAVAAAARMYSTDDTGEVVIVLPIHAELVAEFLDQIYTKPSMGYREYSIRQIRNRTLTDEAKIEDLVTAEAAENLLYQDTFNQSDIEVWFQMDRKETKASLRTLINCRAVRRPYGSHYVKTPAFIAWLRRKIGGPTDDAPF